MLTTSSTLFQPGFLSTLPLQNPIATQPTITLRRAHFHDARMVATMGERIFLSAHRNAGTCDDLQSYTQRAFQLTRVRSELIDPNTHFWIAQSQHETGKRQVAGFFRLRSTTPLPANVVGNSPIEIARFYVDDAWIGRGVSKVMMQQALSQSTALGHDRCWLEVWEGNQRAIAFYEKWGFVAVSQTRYPFGKSYLGAIAMVKEV